MILNVSLATIHCLDQDATRDFYVHKLGFEPRMDARMGEFRWVTIAHPNQPELELTLMVPGPPLSPASAAFIRGQLESGQSGGLGLRVDDCHKTYAELTAAGVEFLQEPADRPYGVEAVMRDNTATGWSWWSRGRSGPRTWRSPPRVRSPADGARRVEPPHGPSRSCRTCVRYSPPCWPRCRTCARTRRSSPALRCGR